MKQRILWTVNAPPGAVRQRILGESSEVTQGSWLHALESALSASGVELGIVWATPLVTTIREWTEHGICYYVIPNGEPRTPFGRWTQTPDAGPALSALEECTRRFAPRVLHIHGSEGPLGLALRRQRPAAVLSLQGLPSQWLRHYWGGLSLVDRLTLTSCREALRGSSVFHARRLYGYAAKRETAILRAAQHVIGRTDFDRMCLRAINPSAAYYHCDEALRDDFMLSAPWSRKSGKKEVVLAISADGAWKGTHDIIKALPLLLARARPVEVRVVGPVGDFGYGHYLRRLAASLGVARRVKWLGPLPGRGVVDQMLQADVFVQPSYIENSPNGLCEAMYLGMPVIATFAGGIPSLLEHGHSGLLYQPGDIASLAGYIEDVLRGPAMASELGAHARCSAQRRHDRATIVSRVLEIYDAL